MGSTKVDLKGGYANMTEVPLVDHELVNELESKVAGLETRETELRRELGELEAVFERRRQPFLEEIEALCQERQRVQLQLATARMPIQPSDSAKQVGPAWLNWVDSNWFGAACNVVVVLNLGCMVLEGKIHNPLVFKCLGHLFLVWYVLELAVKFACYQRNFLCGKPSIVLWSWMDVIIVFFGVLDQWVMPLITMEGKKGPLPINASAFRMLRLLRLLRVLRFLKLLKVFLLGDLSWTESPSFEFFMSGVIAFNGVIMSLELDYPSKKWKWVEVVLLIIYIFELAVRLKRQGCKFFVDTSNILWNYLDVVLVGSSAAVLWLLPLVAFVQSLLGQEGDGADLANNAALHNTMSLLRLLRILRVLRLVRLLKTIKPLYKLLVGVLDSLRAMQWVMVLTFFMLYAGAILWSCLVGRGMLFNGEPPDGTRETFGSVSRSLFSLFQLMNGETSVVDPITDTWCGQILYVVTMVLSNWAILAILTSVISDNMIASSQKANDEEEEHERAASYDERVKRLKAIFLEVDADNSGAISEDEFNVLLKDRRLSRELQDAAMLDERDLRDLFECLATTPERVNAGKKNTMQLSEDVVRKLHKAVTGRLQHHRNDEKLLYYESLIEHLRDEGQPASKRSELRLMSRIEAMEDYMAEQIRVLRRELAEIPTARSERSLH